MGALILAANVFLLLMAYYTMKTVREALILAEGRAEVNAYAAARQAEAPSRILESFTTRKPLSKNVPIPAASFKILSQLIGSIAS